MIRTSLRMLALAAVISAAGLTGCSRTVAVESRPEPSSGDEVGQSPGPSTAATLGIPPGHLPPPGHCRIWVPGEPPGHQSPPGSCSALAGRVPPGAWLVYRPSKDKKHVKVSVYDGVEPGFVVLIRFFEANTGRLVREERAPGR
ncbi:MAG: hypothetical protein PVI01_19935 [Gemmatimonadales bacterium]|jgi:hypothetical protein